MKMAYTSLLQRPLTAKFFLTQRVPACDSKNIHRKFVSIHHIISNIFQWYNIENYSDIAIEAHPFDRIFPN